MGLTRDAARRVAVVKARLRPELDQPYFQVVESYMRPGSCEHKDHGVRLDKQDRMCFCRGCGIQVDPFEALLGYAEAERRLVATEERIRQANQAEAARKQREKERRPFARKVVKRAPIKNMLMKDESVIGQRLTLECGHTRDVGVDNKFKQVTCLQCEQAAKAAQ